MPRTSGPGRGTRASQKGVLSGTTLATVPSGVTIDQSGIQHTSGTAITPAELGYLDGQAGYGVAYTATAGFKLSGGTLAWAGASVTIAHNLTTTLQSIVASYEYAAAVSDPLVALGTNNVSTSSVSVAVYGHPSSVSAAFGLMASGGTVHWMALGK